MTGDRAWALGAADGTYPAAGFHTRGEMGEVHALARRGLAGLHLVVRHGR